MSYLVKFYMLFICKYPFLIGIVIGIFFSISLLPLNQEICDNHVETFPQKLDLIEDNSLSSDYEPIINLNAQKTKDKLTSNKIIIRPRYYSTELGTRERLFIGVYGNYESLSSLVGSHNQTLIKHADKLVYFMGDSSKIIGMPTVLQFEDKEHPLADFLTYLSQHYLNSYDFFFFTNVSTYVHGITLKQYVDNFTLNHTLHLGFTNDNVTCSLEYGVLISRNILEAYHTNIIQCLKTRKNTPQTLSSCIALEAKLNCQNNYEGYSYKVSNFTTDFAQISNKSLTIYPVATASEFYTLQVYLYNMLLENVHSQIQQSQKKIIEITNHYESRNNLSWPIGVQAPFKPERRFDIIPWTYYNNSHSFLQSEASFIDSHKAIEKEDIDNILQECLMMINKKYPKRFTFLNLVNGYKRFDPGRGMEYILDLLLNDVSTGRETFKRIEIVRPLSRVELLSVPYVTEHVRVIITLLVKPSQTEDALKFLDDYVAVCLEKKEITALLLVFIHDPPSLYDATKDEDPFLEIKAQVQNYTNKYKSSGNRLAWLSIKPPHPLPSVLPIFDIFVKKLTRDSLVLVGQPNMKLFTEYLNRVKMNTIFGTQVYFPIPYTQYHPSVITASHDFPTQETLEVKKEFGFYDRHNFDHMSFYVFDYITARESSNVPIVKIESDLNTFASSLGVYECFLQYNKFHIMRAVEPDLRLHYMPRNCKHSSGKQRQLCIDSQLNGMGYKTHLASLLLSKSLEV